MTTSGGSTPEKDASERSRRELSEIYDPVIASELRRIELKTRRNISTDLIGSYRSAFRGRGLVFSDIREYQPGDEVKNIHWKVTARTDKVYVKSYEEDRQLNILLAVDISSSTNFGSKKTKHLRALELAALISILADNNHDSIGLCLFSDQIEEYVPPGRAKNQLKRMLLSLLEHRTLRKGTDLSGALQHIYKHQRRSSVIFLISDFLAPPFEDQLRPLAFKHDVVCVLLEDEIDSKLPAAGIVEFVDAETGERFLVDTSNSRARDRLAEIQRERTQELRAMARRANVDLITVRDHPLRALSDLMHRRTARVR